MNRMRLATDIAFAVTGVAAVYFGYKYDELRTQQKNAAQRQAIWDAAKSNMMKDIDNALAYHSKGDVSDMMRGFRAAALRNRVYEAWSVKNEDLRSQVEQEIQEFGKSGS